MLILTLLRLVAVLERYGAVEYQVVRPGIFAVRAEIPGSQELETVGRSCFGEGTLDLRACHDSERIGVDEVKVVAVSQIGLFGRKETVIETYLGIYAVICVNPVDCGLDFTPVGRVAAS